MAKNIAKFEESSEIVIDTEVESPDTGWTLGHVSVLRVGSLVALHIEATNGVAAAGPVCQLQADFAPPDTITTPDGNFTIGADGTVTFLGSTAAAANRVCQATYVAGQVSP